jgi:hypothetical protein
MHPANRIQHSIVIEPDARVRDFAVADLSPRAG